MAKTKKKRVSEGVWRLPDDRYWVSVEIIRGKRPSKTCDTFKEAKEYARECLRQKYAQKRIQDGLETPEAMRHRIDDAVAEFRKEYSDRATATVLRYNQIMVQFDVFIQLYKLTYLDQFSKQHAANFKEALLDEKPDPKGSTDRVLVPAPKTVNLYLGLIKAFFKRQVELDRLIKSPFEAIRNVKVTKKPPEYYSEEDLRKFFATKMSLYYRRFYIGLLYTGFRFNELASLRWKDIDFEKDLISVCERPGFTAKTHNAYRTIPLADALKKELETLRDGKTPDELVFTTKEGRKIPERTALDKAKLYGKNADLECKVFLHKMRHSFASHLVQRGTRIEELRVLLGHSSINETMVYAHIESKELHHRTKVLDTLNINLD
jgi:integrase